MTEEWIGRDIMSVGFGITGANQNDSGTKRSAELVVSELRQMFVITNNADNENSCLIFVLAIQVALRCILMMRSESGYR